MFQPDEILLFIWEAWKRQYWKKSILIYHCLAFQSKHKDEIRAREPTCFKMRPNRQGPSILWDYVDWIIDTSKMAVDEENKIKCFRTNKNAGEYERSFILKGRVSEKKLQKEEWTAGTKEMAAEILTRASNVSYLRVCSSNTYDPQNLISMLDRRIASNRAATIVSVTTALYPKMNSFDNSEKSSTEKMGKTKRNTSVSK